MIFKLSSPQKLKPRPGFPLAPGQRYAKALILDEEEDVQIPAAINTYLRDYQRDGVKFLWRQYKQGCGGLLGDDMGLVRSCSALESSKPDHSSVDQGLLLSPSITLS